MISPCLTLSFIRYWSRVKWNNPGKGVAPSPTPRCSSYWKGSLLVTLDYGHQLFTFYIDSKLTKFEPKMNNTRNDWTKYSNKICLIFIFVVLILQIYKTNLWSKFCQFWKWKRFLQCINKIGVVYNLDIWFLQDSLFGVINKKEYVQFFTSPDQKKMLLDFIKDTLNELVDEARKDGIILSK